MPKLKANINCVADRVAMPAGRKTRLPRDPMAVVATLGAAAAGAALLEAALVPAVVIGGAIWLAPKYLPKFLVSSGRGLKAVPKAVADLHPIALRIDPPAVGKAQKKIKLARMQVALPRLAIKQAVVKTITFRIIVTSLDFTANYVVIGELATAAGLSAFSLFVGPFFYFIHETGWNYFGPTVKRETSRWGAAVEIPLRLPFQQGAKVPLGAQRKLTVNRALAKTITFRTFATTMDFTTNYVVVGDLATAATLSAFGFLIGPFVYLGHEILWDRLSTPKRAFSIFRHQRASYRLRPEIGFDLYPHVPQNV